MNKWKKLLLNIGVCLGKIVASILIFASCFTLMGLLFQNYHFKLRMLIFAFTIVLLVFIFIIPRNPIINSLLRKKSARIFSIIFITVFSLLAPISLIIYSTIDGNYISADTGFSASSFLNSKKILVISPHQDDEANMASGLMESFTSHGSEVFVVYTTSGDHDNLADVRQIEAVDAMKRMNISPDHLIFLGYGDQWQGQHLYNHPMHDAVISYNNHAVTYGSDSYPDFATQRHGTANKYTRYNLLNDLKDCIELIHPDVIICPDYDTHPDHRATSLLFEEAMGDLLAKQSDWHPVVLKSLSYRSRWLAPSDFYNTTLLQTQKFQAELYPLGTPSYQWENRVRFPIPEQFLTYKILTNEFSKIYNCYPSQEAIRRVESAINSDEIYFERRTDSLLYNQILTSSSGNASLLNNFKLFDTSDISKYIFDAGCWIPTDDIKTVHCNFTEPVDFNTITLWDNPDFNSNVLKAELVLSDGSIIEIPALDPLGAETEVHFADKKGITWMDLKLTETEGEAGLSELELSQRDERPTAFIKLIDSKDNFIYNMPVKTNQLIKFSLYSWPQINPNERFTVHLSQINGDYATTYKEVSADNFSVSIPHEGIYSLVIQSDQHPELYDECILLSDHYKKSSFEINFIKFFERSLAFGYRDLSSLYSRLG